MLVLLIAGIVASSISLRYLGLEIIVFSFFFMHFITISTISNKRLEVCMINDNVFVFNRMLGSNTAIYDEGNKKWKIDRVNDSSTTCFVKFNDNHFTYLQPIAISKDKDVDKKLNNHENIDLVEDDHVIIEESNVYFSLEILEGFYKNIIPLYSLIMSKCNSLIELVAKDRKTNIHYAYFGIMFI